MSLTEPENKKLPNFGLFEHSLRTQPQEKCLGPKNVLNKSAAIPLLVEEMRPKTYIKCFTTRLLRVRMVSISCNDSKCKCLVQLNKIKTPILSDIVMKLESDANISKIQAITTRILYLRLRMLSLGSVRSSPTRLLRAYNF